MNSGYKKATGKVYNREEMKKCKSCGEVFLATDKVCPKCHSGGEYFQRTVSSLDEEREVQNGR